MYAVIIISEEARYHDGTIATKDGDEFILEKGEFGLSTHRFSLPISTDVLVFKSRASAEKVAKEFDSHPWWVVKKDYRIIEIKQKYKQVLDGYTIA